MSLLSLQAGTHLLIPRRHPRAAKEASCASIPLAVTLVPAHTLPTHTKGRSPSRNTSLICNGVRRGGGLCCITSYREVQLYICVCGMRKGGSDSRTQLVAEWILARTKPLHYTLSTLSTNTFRRHFHNHISHRTVLIMVSLTSTCLLALIVGLATGLPTTSKYVFPNVDATF
jgi:hypothetical protein